MSGTAAAERWTRWAGGVGGTRLPVQSARFLLAGAASWLADLAVFILLVGAGARLTEAHIASYLAATALHWLIAYPRAPRGAPRAAAYARLLAVTLLALWPRGAVLAIGVERLAWEPALALLPAIAVAAVVQSLGAALYVYPQPSARPESGRWRVAALGLTAYALLLRALYLGLPDLVPQEAYYWNYARHPALSYLDHPPMAAWLIWLGTAVLGHVELGVRVGAFACWIAAAAFLWAFARNLFDGATALRTVLLAATLPIFFATGFVTSPDAPLVACWAGALCFLERALVAGRRSAWWGVGACLGVGLLSKYTIAFLVAGVVVFLLIDRRSRRWLVRPEPYGAALLAGLLFSPVLLWNARYGWASFAFQSVGRLSEPPEFQLHVLLGAMLLLFTPVGALAIASELTGQARPRDQGDPEVRRRRRFTAVLAGVPFAILVLFSLIHEPKLNWIGPAGLALLPAIASHLPASARRPRGAPGPRAWEVTLVLALLFYGGLLHALTLGLPGIAGRRNGAIWSAWEELGHEVGIIERSLENEIAAQPRAGGLDAEILVVGMDKYFLASSLAFYRQPDGRASRETASWHLFGRPALMYETWFPPEEQHGRTLLLVSVERYELEEDRLADHVECLGPLREQTLVKYGRAVGTFYYRLAGGYGPRDSGVEGAPRPCALKAG